MHCRPTWHSSIPWAVCQDKRLHWPNLCKSIQNVARADLAAPHKCPLSQCTHFLLDLFQNCHKYFSTGRFCIFHHFYGTLKGAGLFQRACQTMKQAGGRGTSRYPIGIKSWPELISNWILMRIIFFCHLISHLWRKMAIVWAIFGMIFRLFTVSDAVMPKKGAHLTWIYLTHVRSRIQAILGQLSHISWLGHHYTKAN